MKKLISIVLTACIIFSFSVFSCAAAETEHTPPFKVIHGTYYYDPLAANSTDNSLESEKSINNAEKGPYTTPPFKVLYGTFSYDPPENSESIPVPMAATKPTSLAPTSFYRTKHYWTATNYTWSSYMFTQALGYRFDCRAKQKFAVEFYNNRGIYEGTAITDYSDIIKGYWVLVDREYNSTPYYVKIVNKSGSRISNNAFYYVSDLGHDLPPGPIS